MRTGYDSPIPPVDELVDVGGGGSGWVVVARARDDIDAHLLMGRLNEAGIETSTIKDRGAPGSWMYGGSNPWAPVSVLVKRVQLDDAKLVLAEISFDSPDAEPPPEPVTRGERVRAGAIWWVVAITLGILLTGITFLGVASRGNDGIRCEIPILCGSE